MADALTGDATPSTTATSIDANGGDRNGNEYEPMSSPTPDDEIYEPISPLSNRRSMTLEDPRGYLIPDPNGQNNQDSSEKETQRDLEAANSKQQSNRTGIISIYEDLWAYTKVKKNDVTKNENPALPIMADDNDTCIYDEVDTLIPSTLPPGAKIISIEEPASAYDEVIVNDSRYMIPSRQWDSDSDAAMESDFDEDTEAPNYFGENFEQLYENLENRKLVSPKPATLPSTNNMPYDDRDQTLKSRGGVLSSCLPHLAKPSKTLEQSNEDDPLYVDANALGEKEPVMPPFSLDMSLEEAARYEIVNKILQSEAAYKEHLSRLMEIDQESRERHLLDAKSLDAIFCSLQKILHCHEMFSMVLAARMNEWTVEGKLGDIICASFSKSTTTMAYTEFVNNFLDAIDTFRASCKTNSVFSQFVQAKVGSIKLKTTFHDLMLKPFIRFSEFIILVQDLLEVTPVGHVDRVHLQLALTHLECLAELINSRRKESEMKSRLKYLDTQISQLSKPLSSSGRVFIRQDDMVHCLIDGVSVIGTKKLRLVLLSDMLLCLSPAANKKRLVPGILNTPKHKFKLKWNVPLSDVQFVEYGTGVSVAAGKYGTTTTYESEGKYRQASKKVRQQIEDLQHDLAVIGQIAGLASSLRGKHELLDQHKVQMWHKSVENTIAEELKTINMFWMELSLPTKSGQHNYVFNLSSPTVKEEWQADAVNAKLALESRNNPGWYLPEDGVTGGLSILRRNMPLLAEYFDLYIFNTRSRVEHMITYPVDTSAVSTSLATSGQGHYVWISARGEMQGYVSLLRFERNGCAPRFLESFNVCQGTVYSLAHIPAMNSRPDQRAEKYHTKYGFPFPTVWLGSHSSRIYIYNAGTDDRSGPLMELKLRDAPLAMKYAMRKVYVGLANGTLAIFRSNTSGQWNLVQPSILPLGRYPVAGIVDVKDKLWCSSGSQIYVVSMRGDRIQRIIAVDSNMKNLVKHVVSCDVGVWVSVWKKATIKLYHPETYDMMQEFNIVSPIAKIKNDVDSQVQYLSVDKISVTALLFIPGFLWVGTSVGLILLYPLPKMQGVPRVVGRPCVAFHAHCGPVRSLLAIPQGCVGKETSNDDATNKGEDTSEIDREYSALADSEESVESDEEFHFVDDKTSSFTSKKKRSDVLQHSGIKDNTQKVKVAVKGLQQAELEGAKLQPDDFARMMESFDGFEPGNNISAKDEEDVRSFRNKLFDAAHPGKDEKQPYVEMVRMAAGDKTLAANNRSGVLEEGLNDGASNNEKTESDSNDKNSLESGSHSGETGGKPGQDQSNCAEEINKDRSVTSVGFGEIEIESDAIGQNASDEQHIYVNVPVKDGIDIDEAGENVFEAKNAKQTEICSQNCSQNMKAVSADGNTVMVNSASETQQENVSKDNEEEKLKFTKGEQKPSSEEQVETDLPAMPLGRSSPQVSRANRPKRGKSLNLSGKVSKDSDDLEKRSSSIGQVVKRASTFLTDKISRPVASDVSKANQQVKMNEGSVNSGKIAGKSDISEKAKEQSSEDVYLTVLPSKADVPKTEGGVGGRVAEDEFGTERSSWLYKTGKTRGKCPSYLVISGGEGHVDLRLKVKSKQDLKKDAQSMFLIWRVSSKM